MGEQIGNENRVMDDDMGIQLTERPDGWLVLAASYRLEVSRSRPEARLAGIDGQAWTTLCLETGVNTVAQADETILPAGETGLVSADAERVLFCRERVSTAWDQAAVWLCCGPDQLSLQAEVSSDHPQRITDVTLAGGRAVRANGAGGEFRSRIDFSSLFLPVPTEPVQVVRPASAAGRLGVVGDAEPGRLHGIFSPPPLVFGFGRVPAGIGAEVPADGSPWLGAALVAPVAELSFTTASYEPLDGGWWLRLCYEGHTSRTSWRSPALVFTAADDVWGVLDRYRELTRPDWVAKPVEPWWLEPIFCGWGAQCALADTLEQQVTDAGTGLVGGSAVLKAAELSRQELYDRWLAKLEANQLCPGTIVIDDKWQRSYGDAHPDQEKWPDLRGWIAARHRQGQRVLLWFKAWDAEGLPAAECVTDPAGHPVAADPSNPGYLRRLEKAVERMLSPGGLDADGFKVDFTQRTPAGQALRSAGTEWGIAALHRLLETVYQAAKAAKPDALVITHAVNPLFADVCDMLRLNDVLELDSAGQPASVRGQLEFRAAVARRSLPGIPLDTDQWPMPGRAEWLDYNRAQVSLGVPALYYLDSINGSAEITTDDLAEIAQLWREYRDGLTALSKV
ncbi:MAG: hypothetical protein LBK28_09470 [Propionibacteriaceae bacterium]|nr:hypothetical protein [Propionibacteriaceae bacterium]